MTFTQHLESNWPSIVTDFILYLIIACITIYGAYRIFKRETERHFQIEKQTFKRYFAALLTELGAAYGAINSLLKSFKTDAAFITSYNLVLPLFKISEKVITEPFLYKYTGVEFMLALHSYFAQGAIVDASLKEYFSIFKNSGQLKKGACDDLANKLENLQKHLLIVQYITQLYVYAYDVKWGPSLSNKGEITEWLNSNSVNIQDLEKKIKELEALSKEEHQRMASSIKNLNFDH